MQITFIYTKDEWIEARKNYLFLSKIITKFQLFILIVLLIVLIALIALFNFNGFIIAYMVLLCILYIMYAYIYFFQPILIYNTTKKYHNQYKLSFSEKEILFETQEINSVLSWSNYTSYFENKKYFYILQSKHNYMLIPKRVFISIEEEQFRNILKSHFEK